MNGGCVRTHNKRATAVTVVTAIRVKAVAIPPPAGDTVKAFCSRIRKNSDNSMTLQNPLKMLQKSYDFCYG